MRFVFDILGKQFKKHDAKHTEWYDYDRPGHEDLIEEFNVPFTGRDGNPLTTDIYRPREPKVGGLPVIILIHGGGLFAGKPIMERDACELLARRGYLVYAPSYRMMFDSDFRGEVDDVCAGFDFAADTLEERGGDPERVFMIAESAGALLGVYAAAMAGSSELQRVTGCIPSRLSLKAVCLVSGMFYTTRKDLPGIAYPSSIYGDLRKDSDFMRYMDAENSEVISNLPPSILTSSRNDFIRHYTLSYHEALIRSGADSSLIYYGRKNKNLVHAFVTMSPELPESKDAFNIICKWFEDRSVH